MDRAQQRGYSEAVITKGGRTVWPVGTATVDDSGKSLASDLRNLDRALQKARGKLSDMCGRPYSSWTRVTVIASRESAEKCLVIASRPRSDHHYRARGS
jgi:hypothetical protein